MQADVQTDRYRARRKLAILGGAPAFHDPLHVGRPNVGDRGKLMTRIARMAESRWLSNSGPFEREFEQRICERLDVRHCVVTCNATVALEILARALCLTGEVILPAFTFVATAHALQWQGITPVFCDILPETHNINPAEIEALITDRTTAVVGVHLWGRSCAIEELQEIAARNSLALLFDAAHAFGSCHHGRPIGNFGRAEVLSFHATKFVNSAEGGAVVTNDDALASRVRSMRNFGFAGYDKVTSLGTNAKLSEPCAALGLTNFESADEFRTANKRNFAAYQNGLAAVPGIRLLEYEEENSPSYHYVVAEVDLSVCGLTRDNLVTVLHAENVLARRYFYPGVHRMEPYCSTATKACLPQTDAVAQRVLVLPTGTAVSPTDAALICDIIGSAVAHRKELRAKLRGAG